MWQQETFDLPRGQQMQLGIGTWAFPWSIGIPGHPQPPNPLDAVSLLHQARTLGLSLVQICDNLPYYDLTPPELAEIRQTADDLGIALGLGTRGVQPDHLLCILDYARHLRAETLRTVIDVPDPTHVTAWMRQVVPHFAAASVTIVLENTEILPVRDIARIVHDVDDPHLRVCLDTANSLGRLETLDQVVEALEPYTRIIHYKDFGVRRVQQAPPVFRMGFEIVGQPAGQGRVDFDRLIAAVAKEGIDPDIILELWPPFLETIEQTVANEATWVEQSVRFLKAKLEG
jgi:sugar phosphate isomerase/epimerase